LSFPAAPKSLRGVKKHKNRKGPLARGGKNKQAGGGETVLADEGREFHGGGAGAQSAQKRAKSKPRGLSQGGAIKVGVLFAKQSGAPDGEGGSNIRAAAGLGGGNFLGPTHGGGARPKGQKRMDVGRGGRGGSQGGRGEIFLTTGGGEKLGRVKFTPGLQLKKESGGRSFPGLAPSWGFRGWNTYKTPPPLRTKTSVVKGEKKKLLGFYCIRKFTGKNKKKIGGPHQKKKKKTPWFFVPPSQKLGGNRPREIGSMQRGPVFSWGGRFPNPTHDRVQNPRFCGWGLGGWWGGPAKMGLWWVCTGFSPGAGWGGGGGGTGGVPTGRQQKLCGKRVLKIKRGGGKFTLIFCHWGQVTPFKRAQRRDKWGPAPQSGIWT